MKPHHDKLTRWEWEALDSKYNIADGHAHQGQNSEQLRIISNLPALFIDTERQNQNSLQEAFRLLFFELAGQNAQSCLSAPLYHYSSSISVEIVANYLRLHKKSAGLIHPTFDNIPAILRRHQVSLYPVNEITLMDPDRLIPGINALFLVLPNNPTGFELNASQFEHLVRVCKERNILIILDFSFRFFSALSEWDQYEVLLRYESEFICIEDTGKTWPTLDLKVGFILSSAYLHTELLRISDDVLLNVSPFIFALLVEYITLERELPEEYTVINLARANRAILRQALSDTPLESVNSSSNISVEWIRLPSSWNSEHFCRWLERRQICLLPGPPFFWDQMDLGLSYVRLALMRPRDFFLTAAESLRNAALEYAEYIAKGSQ